MRDIVCGARRSRLGRFGFDLEAELWKEILVVACQGKHRKGWDEKRKVQYRRVDRYLLPRKIPIVTHPGKEPGKYTWSFHKPIEAYVRALRNAGMLVDAMEEWTSHKKSTSGPRAGAENVAREEIPMFLAVRAVKIGKFE